MDFFSSMLNKEMYFFAEDTQLNYISLRSY